MARARKVMRMTPRNVGGGFLMIVAGVVVFSFVAFVLLMIYEAVAG